MQIYRQFWFYVFRPWKLHSALSCFSARRAHTEASHPFCHTEVWGLWLYRRVAYILHKRGFCITSTCVRLKQLTTGRAQVVPCSENELTLLFPLLTSPASLLIFWCLMFLDLLQSRSAHVYFLTHHILTAIVVIHCRIPLRVNSVHPPVRNNRFSCITRIQRKRKASTHRMRIV